MINEKERTISRSFDSSLRSMNDKLQKQVDSTNLDLKEQAFHFEESRKKMENDLQYMDTKLSMVDDSAIMKKWVQSQLSNLRLQIEQSIDSS